ncbi:hypothetical protein DL93DRAFT_2088251 [Clavulina sp. PMI_390]|nr:hypothetical protein DL93DRAFT_2088251 [Clavulina sp. PMI_390]
MRATPSGVAASLCFIFGDDNDTQRPPHHDRLNRMHEATSTEYTTTTLPNSTSHTTIATRVTPCSVAASLCSIFGNRNNGQYPASPDHSNACQMR